ncbi:MAG TPA: DUF2796 domain-containing protein [Burkholderiales bacterium]|nr:DUF2796 domain-containing protein [Burkholderiales bacterium]
MQKSTKFVRIASCAGILSTLTAPAQAADAHVHGVATLQVALDGNRLNVDFSSPLDNLVGFEHAPRTDKQKAAVRQMAERLNAPELWFVPNAEAECKRTSVNLESAVLDRALLSGAERKSSMGKPDARKDTKSQAGEHSALSADIVFICDRPRALSGLELKLFDAFPKLKRIDAQVAVTNKQRAAKLTPRARHLAF